MRTGGGDIDCTDKAIFTYNTKKEKVSIYDGLFDFIPKTSFFFPGTGFPEKGCDHIKSAVRFRSWRENALIAGTPLVYRNMEG